MLVTPAAPVLAGGGSNSQAGPSRTLHAQIHRPDGHQTREQLEKNARGVRGEAHVRAGGPRLDQRPDPNHQNPYRPMYSLDATNPGEPHPYFQTRKEGFGYPASRSSAVYLGNGVYVIPR